MHLLIHTLLSIYFISTLLCLLLTLVAGFRPVHAQGLPSFEDLQKVVDEARSIVARAKERVAVGGQSGKEVEPEREKCGKGGKSGIGLSLAHGGESDSEADSRKWAEYCFKPIVQITSVNGFISWF